MSKVKRYQFCGPLAATPTANQNLAHRLRSAADEAANALMFRRADTLESIKELQALAKEALEFVEAHTGDAA